VPGAIAVKLRRHPRDYGPAAARGLLFRGLLGTSMLRRDQFHSSAWRPALRGAGSLGERKFVIHALRHFAVNNMLSEAPITAVAG
jgi:integrase